MSFTEAEQKKIKKAIEFAKWKHAGHERKYTGEPYFVHLEEVANFVIEYGGDANMVIAAYLHDTVEDTATTLTEIEDAFDNDVRTLVQWLTDISNPADGNRKVRKAKDRDHTAASPVRAQTIKYADTLSNLLNIRIHDPDFAKVYFREKRAVMEVATRGNLELGARVWSVINDYFAQGE